LSNTLADFADDDVAGRHPVVQEIKALTREIADTYQEPASQPSTVHRPSSTELPPSPLEALRQIQNTRSNITKWGKKLEAARTPDEKAKAMNKVEELVLLRIKLQSIVDESTRTTTAA
jgi:hypothetical protein